jgi:hypothetical protein
MNATEAIATITEAVIKALKIRLAPGEKCPFCGHKKGQRKVSEKMLAANRANIRLANDARRKK